MTDTPAHLAEEARQLADARRVSVARGQGNVSEIAPSGAVLDSLDPLLGQYGAVVLRELNTSGRVYEAGSFIPADVVLSWRPANRAALQQQRRVVYLAAPRAAEGSR